MTFIGTAKCSNGVYLMQSSSSVHRIVEASFSCYSWLCFELFQTVLDTIIITINRESEQVTFTHRYNYYFSFPDRGEPT